MDPDVLVAVEQYSSGPGAAPVDLILRRGARVGVAGASGSGKTTLLRWIAGFPPAPGQQATCRAIAIQGRIALVPQQTGASLSPYLRAHTQVDLLSATPGTELLDSVGLGAPRLQASHPCELSGGERQRVLWAQALALRPDLLIADEPTASLDHETASGVLDLVDATGHALLIASHDESVFARLGCTQIIRLTPEPALPPDPFNAPQLPADPAPVLVATGLEKTWRGHPAVAGVGLQLAPAELVALTGPSGCGKSTLAACLASRTRPDRGSVAFHHSLDGRPAWRRVQLVQQDPAQSLNPRHTIAEALRESGAQEAATDLLDAFEIPRAWHQRRTAELSEGQRARVAIARHLAALDPRGLLILDESLAALDDGSARLVLAVIRSQQRRTGIACLWITHHLKLARASADRLLQMRAGRLVA